MGTLVKADCLAPLPRALGDKKEIAQILQKMDELPAGGGAVGAVVGAGLIIFFVLLITDIVGATDVYSFVNN